MESKKKHKILSVDPPQERVRRPRAAKQCVRPRRCPISAAGSETAFSRRFLPLAIPRFSRSSIRLLQTQGSIRRKSFYAPPHAFLGVPDASFFPKMATIQPDSQCLSGHLPARSSRHWTKHRLSVHLESPLNRHGVPKHGERWQTVYPHFGG